MQAPVENEKIVSFTRDTAAGRTLSYRLKVIQQPEKARACGNGPRSSADRRPVDPPPVVKLTIYEGGRDITQSYEAGFMLFAGLEFARPIAQGRIHQNSHISPVLTGVCVAGAAYLSKPKNAAYFIFPDLSVRHEGWYRLKFHLFEQIKHADDADPDRPFVIATTSDRENPQPPNRHENMSNRTYVYSAPFQVFSAKKFPGLNTSTELSQIVAEQGCRVRIRRDIRQRRVTKKPKDEDERRPGHGASAHALNHERSQSRDSADHRHVAPELPRRPSIDSHVSPSYGSSRQPSMDHGFLTSPMTAPSLHRLSGPPASLSSPMTAQYGSAAPNLHSQVPLHPHPRLHHPVHQPRLPPPSQHGSISQSMSASFSHESSGTTLPSIHQLLEQHRQETPSSQPSMRGTYSLPEPTALKRAHRFDKDVSLKSGARPSQIHQPSATRRSTLDWVLNETTPRSFATGDVILEADPDPEHDNSDSDDSILDDPRHYKRANGTMVGIPPLRVR